MRPSLPSLAHAILARPVHEIVLVVAPLIVPYVLAAPRALADEPASACGTIAEPPLGGTSNACDASHTSPTIQNFLAGVEYVIPVVFHDIYRPGFRQPLAEARFLEQIDFLNRAFSGRLCEDGQKQPCVDSKIRFALKEINVVQDEVNYELFGLNDTRQSALESLYGSDPELYLNVYVVELGMQELQPICPGSASFAWAYLPWEFMNPEAVLRGIVIDDDIVGPFSSAPIERDRGAILAHEIGHFFGLYHTFPLPLPGVSCASSVAPNCYSDGDLICDTIPELVEVFCPTATSYCDPPYQSCGANQPSDNIMSYKSDPCMWVFTAEQIGRMRCVLESELTNLGTTVDFEVEPLNGALASDAASWGDFNADGRDDLALKTVTSQSGVRLYPNLAGTFAEATPALISSLSSISFLNVVDLQGDRTADVVALRDPQYSASSILVSDYAGQFSVGPTLSLAVTAWHSSWVDFDGDRDLDLHVPGNSTSQMLRNDGGNFTPVAVNGLPVGGVSSAWCDWDNDGDADVFVAGVTGGFYESLGEGWFAQTNAGLITTNLYGGACWGDYNNDGYPDLFVWDGVGVDENANLLLRNQGGGTFVEVFDDDFVFVQPGGLPVVVRTAAWEDQDLDGDSDLLVTTALGTSYFRNESGVAFIEQRSVPKHADEIGLAFSDIDLDGDRDAAAPRGFSSQAVLYRNVLANENAWLSIRLRGHSKNRDGVGARIVVTTDQGTQSRWTSAAQTGRMQHSRRAHFGLGGASTVEQLVVYWPAGGVTALENLATNQELEIEEAPAVPFTNASIESQLANGQAAEQVAASLALQVNGDTGGYEDLIVGTVGGPLRVYQNLGPLNPATDDFVAFAEQSQLWWRNTDGVPTAPPLNARGLSSADIDNDLDADLFVALGRQPQTLAPQPPLLSGSQITQGSGQLWISDTLPAEDLTDTWAGAFGDFDGDGAPDLYLARCEATEPTTAAFVAASGLTDILLRNNGLGTFVNAVPDYAVFTSATANVNVPSKTIAARWGYVNGDNMQDLYVAWLGEAFPNAVELKWSPLFINLGPIAQGRFVLSDRAGEVVAPKFPRLGRVSDVQFPDVDGDGLLDIALARQVPGAGQQNILVCLNLGGGDITDEPPGWGLNGTGTLPMHSLQLADLDQNGKLDLLAAPVGESTPVPLYSGFPAAGAAGVEFYELGQESGLDIGAARSITLADFNRDGDEDLFLGRVLDNNIAEQKGFFFTNGKITPAGSANSNNTLRVRPQSLTGAAARTVTGTTVLVTANSGGSPIAQCQMVDGGGGRMQRTGALAFGVGQATTANVEAHFPNGSVVTLNGVPVNGPELIVQPPHTPLIIAASVTASYTMSGDWATWKFEADINGTADFMRVIFPGKAPTGLCGVLPADMDLRPGDPGVSWSVTPTGVPGVFHLTLIRTAISCAAPCTYNYKLEVKYLSSTATSTTYQLAISICGGFQE